MALQPLASVDAALGWLRARGVLSLATDSRKVRAGDAFIAWPGYGVDGRQFVPQALAAGAAACLVEADGAETFGFDAEPAVAALPGLKAATGPLASAFFGAPSEQMKVVASTGTNGKTSTAWWVAQALSTLGQRCGVVGTLGIGEPPRLRATGGEPPRPHATGGEPSRPHATGGEPSNTTHPGAAVVSTGLTTPDPVTLQAALRRFADTGFVACALEASSIGLVEHRLAGTRIAVALFTNFTLDHLDFHGTMAAYWQAKAQLFAWPGLQAAVINIDDAHGASLAGKLRSGALDVWTTAVHAEARLRADAVHYADGGLCFDVLESGQREHVRTRLIGDYNVANLLGVIGALRALGVPLADAAAACEWLTPVPGRMERVPHGDARGATAAPDVVVDYAHTPDALDKALRALQPFAAERGGALWCVFGCGGDRDAGKRPLMGEVAAELAQRVVVTSDNPRSEAPGAIVAQIAAGIDADALASGRVRLIEDRRDAIAHAVREADARDVILIAGKGHEDYQEIAGVRHPFFDAAEARAALQRRGAAA